MILTCMDWRISQAGELLEILAASYPQM